MENQKQGFNFLLIILAGSFILLFFVFRPFLYSLILAMILAVVAWPLYQKLLKLFQGHKSPAALLTTLIVFIFILTPLIFLGIQIFKEAQQLYLSLTQDGGKDILLNILENATQKIQDKIPGGRNISIDFSQYIKQGANWFVENLGIIFSSFTAILAEIFIFVIAFYYFLKEAINLRQILLTINLLRGSDAEKILERLSLAITSVIKGNLAVAIIQGILASIGLAIFGVPNPALWGTVAAVTSLIPGIGTSLVMIPAIGYLFLTGNLFMGFGLLAWAVLAVGLIDNFLGPKIVGRDVHLHPLLVILSVLGGITFFGPIGFLLGPLSVALFITVFDIYLNFNKQEG